MYARMRDPKSLLTLYQILIKPNYPSLADEKAEPHLDMKIKVGDNTLSEKSINSVYHMTSRLGVKYCHAIKLINH